MSKTIENVEEKKEYGRTYPVTAMEKTVKHCKTDLLAASFDGVINDRRTSKLLPR
jgi:hypothetical protein